MKMKLKRWSGGAVIFSLFILLVLSFRNFSQGELLALQTWNHFEHLITHAQGLPHAIEAIKEAGAAWKKLMVSVEDESLSASGNGSAHQKAKEKQCPYSIKRMNVSEFDNGSFKFNIPCGLVQGSSVTFIGTPDGLLGNFRIDLTGTTVPGEPDPPVVLHYNVRLHGDKITEDPVIVQNTWTAGNDWGPEERCPSPDPKGIKKVDDLEQCSAMVGKDDKRVLASTRHLNASKRSSNKEGAKPKQYFPFKQGYLAIATLRVGVEGIQMTVDGKHITSFAYRESLEPWLVSEVRISGDINLISVLASGLPTSEDLEHVIDLELLKSPPLPMHKAVDLFIGVFSTANNFKRRMAVRRTWMQYDAVRSGAVAVRFFVGLHKNEMVNEELWNEARTYGDIQLMPFVDYYSLITWKTVAICIYGTNSVSAKYVMKTDDDSFVRVDEVLASLDTANVTKGLLYGRINSDAQPHRNPESKWFISPEEWPEEKYPPWAHGPGYVVSKDIAEAIYELHKEGHLKMFKLEDVAMGIWIAELKKKGLAINYVKEERVYIEGCESGYVVAHYQEPRELLCLWDKLQDTKRALCCGEP
ncbi:beta-1,3-galactosyltransferase GALT1 isoform X2 [Dioscorea cayenensis subsp. rotundata]|uniref:Beta-1,3-galactosyltransferase GALT1 isoform X2 n=1 Tax=Dioscorea cayennensis subsp. rotundata TaxID=55577 RepID=A0AB40BE65_DIOCR|nr:beta-1,3-galactosyltransferase GALT1 isoform X2 [Dioscorea cayenensis subsp. rotundata]